MTLPVCGGDFCWGPAGPEMTSQTEPAPPAALCCSPGDGVPADAAHSKKTWSRGRKVWNIEVKGGGREMSNVKTGWLSSTWLNLYRITVWCGLVRHVVMNWFQLQASFYISHKKASHIRIAFYLYWQRLSFFTLPKGITVNIFVMLKTK